MIRSKYRMTGFARFFIFLLFFVPVAYVGASYYNGEDGIAKIKSLLQIDQNDTKVNVDSNGDCKVLLQKKDREIERLKKTIRRLDNR